MVTWMTPLVSGPEHFVPWMAIGLRAESRDGYGSCRPVLEGAHGWNMPVTRRKWAAPLFPESQQACAHQQKVRGQES